MTLKSSVTSLPRTVMRKETLLLCLRAQMFGYGCARHLIWYVLAQRYYSLNFYGRLTIFDQGFAEAYMLQEVECKNLLGLFGVSPRRSIAFDWRLLLINF
jgi:hypothetical protein